MCTDIEMWTLTDTAHVGHGDDDPGLYDYTSVPVPVFESPCRTGCKTKDHASYGECLKACAVQIGNLK